ncbi:MAG: CDP-alcohol phosphatidyltransferase [Fluviicola sp.]|jgi:CDP-diacylglycerol--serine O-phosphatidyltransferase|uniref:CDP-alcohol phosphatidyltransferase family protein n=1 Tax=Fluviicola sp. TaxID=1917219 RepID=UPI002613F5EF|nr:CDP-alcohol phosphatidyltransferase family protein [Fluviicola sp.]MDF3029170.1 CDP-alcohol phosphatidyltransferase [Fluviicola sp.]
MKMFNIPNLITASNMLCGVFAIILAFAGRIDIAPYFIFLAAILDFFDGFAARLLKQQGELGKQLDSLADMISFGLAPGIIMFVLILLEQNDINRLFEDTVSLNLSVGVHLSGLVNFQLENKLPFLALIIPFFSLFRLAKFNIDTRQSESFIGLPTPANTIFFMAFPLLLSRYGGTTGWEHDLIMWLIQPIVLIPIIVIMSLLLVSELPLFALKFKHFKWKGNATRYIFLISCGILISTLLIWSIPIIVLLYLLLSFIQHILRKNRTHEIQS